MTYNEQLRTISNEQLSTISKEQLETIYRLTKDFDSFYIYNEVTIHSQIDTIKKVFPEVEFLYSLKCNSFYPVLQSIVKKRVGIDAASVGEVELSHKAGVANENIYYSSPGKTEEELAFAHDKSRIIVDSIGEIERLEKLGTQLDKVIKIGIRINPNFSFTEEVGSSSKFGIDEDEAIKFLTDSAVQFSHIEVDGLHVHVKSQELAANKLAFYYKHVLALSGKLFTLGVELSYINLGSGIGISYSKEDQTLDLATLGKVVNPLFQSFREAHPDTKLLIELGRFMVGSSGYYITKVVDRKNSQGKTFIILKNTLNGFIRPSIAKLIEKYSNNYGQLVGSEPLFTTKNPVAFDVLKHRDTQVRLW